MNKKWLDYNIYLDKYNNWSHIQMTKNMWRNWNIILDWFTINLSKRYTGCSDDGGNLYFESKDDAILFKMKWS
jgi:hypothetical protein